MFHSASSQLTLSDSMTLVNVLSVEFLIIGICAFLARKLLKGRPTNILFGVFGGMIFAMVGNLLKFGSIWVSGLVFSIVGTFLVYWLSKRFV